LLESMEFSPTGHQSPADLSINGQHGLKSRLPELEKDVGLACPSLLPSKQHWPPEGAAAPPSAEKGFSFLRNGLSGSPSSSRPSEVVSSSEALQMLDSSLDSYRAEVAALNMVRSMTTAAVSEASPPNEAQVFERPPRVLSASRPRRNRAKTFAPVGLRCLLQLSDHMQGRLAACSSLSEAIEVFDEALPLVPSRNVVDDDNCAASSCGLGSKCGSSCSSSRSLDSTCFDASAELVSANAELLRAARERVAGLEAEFLDRQRQHERQIELLRRRYRQERNQSLQNFVKRLSLVQESGGSPGGAVAARERADNIGPSDTTSPTRLPDQQREHALCSTSRTIREDARPVEAVDGVDAAEGVT